MQPRISRSHLRDHEQAKRQSLSDRCRLGPRKADFDEIAQMVDRFVTARIEDPAAPLSDEHRSAIHRFFGEALTTSRTLMGFCFSKPHGYSGDYEIIDRIYTRYESSEPVAARWDRFFQAQPAPQAVRNRKAYFKALLVEKARRRGRLKVLDLASGPARDLEEFFAENPELSDRVAVDCIDLDANAIAHAKDLLGESARNVRFEQANVFKYRSREKYDLVWSAGLFDYFDDRTFVAMISKFARNVAPDGELNLGNFHPRNPSRSLMTMQDWILNHRTEEDLEALARQALGDDAQVTVDSEPEGVNLFLRIRPTA